MKVNIVDDSGMVHGIESKDMDKRFVIGILWHCERMLSEDNDGTYTFALKENEKIFHSYIEACKKWK